MGSCIQEEIEKCICKLKNNKTGGSDGLVGELLKYGGVGIMNLLHQLFEVVRHEETVPKQWREGLIVNLFKKGDKEIRYFQRVKYLVAGHGVIIPFHKHQVTVI